MSFTCKEEQLYSQGRQRSRWAQLGPQEAWAGLIQLSLQSRTGDWESWGGLVRTECEAACKDIRGRIHHPYPKMDPIGPIKGKQKQEIDQQRGGAELME